MTCVGFGAVADEVAEDDDAVESLAPARAREHRREGLVVGVDVGEDQIAHRCSTDLDFRADSAGLESASSTRSAASSIDSRAAQSDADRRHSIERLPLGEERRGLLGAR